MTDPFGFEEKPVQETATEGVTTDEQVQPEQPQSEQLNPEQQPVTEQAAAQPAANAETADENKKIFGLSEKTYKLITRITLFATLCLMVLLTLVAYGSFKTVPDQSVVSVTKGIFSFAFVGDYSCKEQLTRITEIISGMGSNVPTSAIAGYMFDLYLYVGHILFVFAFLVLLIINLVKGILAFTGKKDDKLAVSLVGMFKTNLLALIGFATFSYAAPEGGYTTIQAGGGLIAATAIGLVVIIAYAVVNFLVNKKVIFAVNTKEKLCASLSTFVLYFIIFMIFANAHLYGCISTLFSLMAKMDANGNIPQAYEAETAEAGANMLVFMGAIAAMGRASRGIGGSLRFLVTANDTNPNANKKYALGFIGATIALGFAAMGVVATEPSLHFGLAATMSGAVIFAFILAIIGIVQYFVFRKVKIFDKNKDIEPDDAAGGNYNDYKPQ